MYHLKKKSRFENILIFALLIFTKHMVNKLLLLGDEAIALGALDAGLSGIYAYPGTPSTEITEYVQHTVEAGGRKVHCTWSSNKKPPWKLPSVCHTPESGRWSA